MGGTSKGALKEDVGIKELSPQYVFFTMPQINLFSS